MLNISYFLNNVSKQTSINNDDLMILDHLDNNRRTINIKALKNIKLTNGKIKLDIVLNDDDLYFFNGYQSWTDTKEATIKDKEKNVKKIPSLLNKMFAFDRYGDTLFYDYHKTKLHGYDVFYIKGKNELFSFNYNYDQAYLVYELNKKEKTLSLISDVNGISLKENEDFKIFDYSLFSSIKDGLNDLYSLFPLKQTKKIFGYTSWYNYYQNINEEIILRDLESLDSRFNLFQIDDGYETFVGDWLDVDQNKFPNGLKGIVEKIHNKGYLAGIWLAPFVAEEKSKLFSEHKELFKMENGEYVKCGANWSGFYALDLENEDAKKYIKKCLDYYKDLGFDFYKLDFLYGANLPLYENKTRAMAAKDAYEFLREVLEDKLVLGCGAVISNSINRFDYLRVGPDVSLIFDDVWFMKYMHRERISTKLTLQNTIYRSIFNNHFFLNDPDVFLLREDNIKLSNEQKKALVIINSLFGSVLMTSDNISDYGIEQNALLEEAFDLFYNSKDVKFVKNGKYINIEYTLNDKHHNLKYNTLKGVME